MRRTDRTENGSEKKVIGEPVPFSKLNGVTKAAAGVSCLVEAGQKEAMENAKK